MGNPGQWVKEMSDASSMNSAPVPGYSPPSIPSLVHRLVDEIAFLEKLVYDVAGMATGYKSQPQEVEPLPVGYPGGIHGEVHRMVDHARRQVDEMQTAMNILRNAFTTDEG